MKKMNALQVVQSADYLAGTWRGNNLNTVQTAAETSVTPDSPAAIDSIVGLQLNPNEEFYMKRCYCTVYWYNASPYPCNLEAHWLYVRKDIPANLSLGGILNQGSTASNLPYLSPFTGDDFRSYFRVLKSKRILFKPMTQRKFVCKRNFGNYKLDATVDLDGLTYAYKRGNRILYFRYYGVPLINYNSNNGGIPLEYKNTMLGPMLLRGITTNYYSFYRVGVNQPNNSVVGNIPLVMQSVNNSAIPNVTQFFGHPNYTETGEFVNNNEYLTQFQVVSSTPD